MLKPSRQSGHRVFLAACALVAPLVFAVVPSVRAQEPAAPQNPATDKIIHQIEVRDARLESTIAALMSQNGLNNIVVVNEPGQSFGLVTVNLIDQPLRKVLQAIATSAGAVLKEEDGIFYLRHKSDKDEPKPQEAPKPAAPTTPAVAIPAKPKPHQLARIPLVFLQPSVFVKMLDDPAYLAIVETTIPETETPLRMNAPPPLPILREGTDNNAGGRPLNVGSPQTTPPPSGASGSGAGRSGGDEAGARGQGIPGGGGRFGGGLGAGGQGAGGFGGGPGGFGQGPGGAGGQQGQNSLRPPGILNIVASDAQNALIVEYDDVDDLNRLREIIRLLDVAPQQVQVKAEFVAVNIADADSFGVDWRFQPAGNLDVAVPPESGTQPTITMAYSSGNAVANMRASLIRTTQNVLQAPLITTINNRPANINFNTVVSIPQTTNIVGANGQIVSGTTFIPVQANNGLNVTPHINGDGTITMFLQPFLSTVNQQAGGGFGGTSQSLTTTRRIRNGETMVLGGFITKQENRTLRKVPILADLPIIGNLFQQKSRDVSGSEVLVFVTATIIDESGNNTTSTVGGVATPNPAPNP